MRSESARRKISVSRKGVPNPKVAAANLGRKHYIKPWKLFPELRYDVNNETTLCNSCHKREERKAS